MEALFRQDSRLCIWICCRRGHTTLLRCSTVFCRPNTWNSSDGKLFHVLSSPGLMVKCRCRSRYILCRIVWKIIIIIKMLVFCFYEINVDSNLSIKFQLFHHCINEKFFWLKKNIHLYNFFVIWKSSMSVRINCIIEKLLNNNWLWGVWPFIQSYYFDYFDLYRNK